MKKLVSAIVLTMFACSISSGVSTLGYKNNNGRISPKIEQAIKYCINAPSQFRDLPRKNYNERFKDCLDFYKQGGDISYYNAYGLDVKNFRDKKDFLSWYDVTKDRINWQKQSKHKYKDLQRKDQFDAYMKEIAPNFIPKSFFKFKRGFVISKNLYGTHFVKAMNTLKDGTYFLKQVDSACGRVVFLIEKNGKNIVINKGQISLNTFVKSIINNGNIYILQEKVIQHPEIAKFNPATTNTIRIVTTHFNNKSHVLTASLNMGTQADTWVSNTSQGGTFVGINENSGTLMDWGYYMYGTGKTREKKHPLTKIEYKGQKIPYWKETVELVKRLHDKMDYYTSLGWDVAITKDGPVVIETNELWDIVDQASSGGLKPKWEKLKVAE